MSYLSPGGIILPYATPAAPLAFEMPRDSHRLTLIGKTGSGKTQAGLWHLSHRTVQTRPWIVFDFKRDPIFWEVPAMREIGLTEKLPKHPGLYIIHPTPDQTEAVDDMMWDIWERERIGVFLDEGYMVPPRSPGFQALLTQGRAKSIPIIMGTQRPAWVTRFAFSEADFIQYFRLTDWRDVKVAKQFMPMPIENPLPGSYWSYWWDNGRNYRTRLQPVPPKDTILDRLHDRLTKRKRVL